MVGVVVEKRLLVEREGAVRSEEAGPCVCLRLGAAPSSPDHHLGSPIATPTNNFCINARSNILLKAVFLRYAAGLCIWTHALIKTNQSVHLLPLTHR